MNVTPHSKRSLILLLLLLSSTVFTMVPLVPYAKATGISGAATWYVSIGSESTDSALQALNFYPGVIVVDAGDTITWTLNTHEPHTVSFCVPVSLCPSASSPAADAPAGGGIFNGTGYVSSGLLAFGQSYNVTFTQTGVYTYYCLIHPGMQGVVIVQNTGLGYPVTQTQYNQQSQPTILSDLSAGTSVQNAYHPTETRGPNNTAVYHVAAGVSVPQTASATLASTRNSPVNGTATLSMAGSSVSIQISLISQAKSASYLASLRRGTCTIDAGLITQLKGMQVDATGIGSSATTVNNTQGIPSSGWYIGVYLPQGYLAACGNVVYHNTAVMRFLPNPLVINAGDTIIWSQLSPQEIHTVTIVPPGNPIPDYPSKQAFTPIGNGSSYPGTGYYNSGVLASGQSYVLTFPVAGLYTYYCVLHDDMGMVGTIVVLPSSSQLIALASSLNSKLDTQSGQLNSLNKTVSSISSALTQLQSSLTQLQSNVKQLQSSSPGQFDLSGITNSISSISNNISSISNRLGALQSSLNQLDSAAARKSDMNSVSSQVSSLSSQLAVTADVAYAAIAVAVVLGVIAIAMSRKKGIP